MKLLTPNEFKQAHGDDRPSDIESLSANEWKLLVSIKNTLEAGGLQVIHDEYPSVSIYNILLYFGWSCHATPNTSSTKFLINIHRA